MNKYSAIIDTKRQLLKNSSLKDYYPDLINDLDYYWNELPNKIEMLSEEEKIDQYSEITQSIILYFLEFIKKYLKELYNIDIDYELDEIQVIGGCAAYNYHDNKILVSTLGMLIQLENNTSFIQPILHEFRHKLQHDFYQEHDIKSILKYPPYFILIAKHYIYSKSHDSNFYLDNYTNLYPEIDAEEYSLYFLNDFLLDLHSIYNNDLLTEKVIYLQQEIREDLLVIYEILKEKGRVDTSLSQELYSTNPILSTFLVDKTIIDSLVEISYYLNNNPQLQNTYPILNILWNNDKPKDYQELINEKKVLLETIPNQKIKIIGTNIETTTHQQIQEIFNNIIKSDPILQLSEYLYYKKVEKVSIFLKQHPDLIKNKVKQKTIH